mmetsp:Transcript_60122/g.123476  ORF Transcript_60122/g.123476 Transcript_60122/m.123476 type:complete len:248 (-) Transcript_60122:137-880(-)
MRLCAMSSCLLTGTPTKVSPTRRSSSKHSRASSAVKINRRPAEEQHKRISSTPPKPPPPLGKCALARSALEQSTAANSWGRSQGQGRGRTTTWRGKSRLLSRLLTRWEGCCRWLPRMCSSPSRQQAASRSKNCTLPSRRAKHKTGGAACRSAICGQRRSRISCSRSMCAARWRKRNRNHDQNHRPLPPRLHHWADQKQCLLLHHHHHHHHHHYHHYHHPSQHRRHPMRKDQNWNLMPSLRQQRQPGT